MSNLLGLGSSALLAYRQALDVTANNIANANTEGYVRQRIELAERPGANGGVIARRVVRDADALTQTRLLADTSRHARTVTYAGHAERLDALLSSPDTGLSEPLSAFYQSFSALAADPASTPVRQQVLGRAETLTQRFAELQAQLDTEASVLGDSLQVAVADINNASQAIAQLNLRIAEATSQGQQANDLLDQRDRHLSDLSSRVGISRVQQQDGSVSVYLGSGQALVLGSQAYALSVSSGGSDGLQLLYGSGAGAVALTRQVSGGEIGALLDYEREMLKPAAAELGRLAAGLAAQLNAQHRVGMDADGDPGADFFMPLSVPAIGAAANTGSALVQIQPNDPANLTLDDYRLQYASGTWSLSREPDGSTVPLSGTGTLSDPYSGPGFRLQISGTPSEGDVFALQPVRGLAGELRLALTDSRQIAAASLAGGPVLNSGDNTNARALAALADTGLLSAGRVSLQDAQSRWVTRIGTQTQGAGFSRDAAQALRQQTLAEYDAKSGVNLDEEAADLLRWQQAYQAAAQLVATANTLFETLLGATRR